MKIADILLLDYDSEIASTRRVLELVPDGKADWKPHEKSATISRLAMHVATLPRFGTVILTTPHWDMLVDKLPPIPYHSTEHTLALFEQFADEARHTLSTRTDAELEQTWKFSAGERIVGEMPRSAAWRRFFFNHMMHHRSQLLVDLRLLNIPLPGLYGPSADDHLKS